MQRPFNSSLDRASPLHPRNGNGAQKPAAAAPVKPGMTRQTSGEPAAYHHGVTTDDTPNTIKSHDKPIGFNHGVTDAQIIKSTHSAIASQVLDEAARLGQPVEKE